MPTRLPHAGSITAGLGVFLLLAGCGGGKQGSDAASGEAAEPPTVDLHVPDDAKPTLKLSDQPVAEVGGDGAKETPLLVSADDMRMLSDGRLAVADEGANQIHIYDSVGKHLLNIGRKGRGPGEFQRVTWVEVMPGDTLAAWDEDADGEISVFTPAGVFVRRLPPATGKPTMSADLTGVFGDGSAVFSHQVANSRGAYTHATLLQETSDSFPTPLPRRAPRDLRLAWDSWQLETVGDSLFYYNWSSNPEILVYSKKGKLLRRLRPTAPPRKVTAAMKDAFRASLLEGRSDSAAKAHAAALIFPSELPFYNSLAEDRTGRLWIGRYVTGRYEQTVYDLVTPAGHYEGTIAIPAGKSYLLAGRDWIWLSGLSADGSQHLYKYKLTPAP